MRKNHLRAKPAFTLIEIIIVVALTLFLLVVTIQGMVNSSAQFTFNNEAEKIQAMIRTARSLAISGKAQLDYTDYNNNECTDDAGTTHPPKCIAPEYVTPAHYGVLFQKLDDGINAVTLFVDNHSKTANQEGKYGMGDPHTGSDYLLDFFKLPLGMQLIMPDAGNQASIFFSPVFADVSSDINIPADAPFFKFGIEQTQGGIIRKRCWQIQMVAGISEPIACP